MASRPIDEKLVVMRLENEQFKAKATETVGLFGKLKQALGNVGNTRFDKVSNELNGIQKSANGINMNNLSSAVDTISNRFSTLGVIATTALTNITNRAVNAGMALKHSLTTQQITDGFREYETKIGSIGTVLSNTEWAGTTLEDVKRVLEELNVYADNTVYSFGQMTENIGRFTAAGVTIDDSAIAIKGLSNLAAASGSNVQQLNTAMYQMSQSMAAGTFNLMDWNSLVNAGMAGKKTQDALLETARAMGVNVDMSEGFRNSISKGWLTAEVFLETMKKFGKDESMTEAATAVRTFTGMMDALKEGIGSGWATSWEIIFGDYEKATRFWTAISNALTGVFAKQSQARNEMLQNLANSGALENFGRVIQNVGTPVVQLFKSIGSAFRQVFPPKSSDGLVKVASGLANVTSHLKMSEGTVQNVTTIFKGLFSIFSTGFEVIKIIGSALLGLVPSFESTGGGALGLVARLFEIPIALNEFIKSSNAVDAVAKTLKSVFNGIGKVLGLVGAAFMSLGDIVDRTFSIFAKADFGETPVAEESGIVKVLIGIRDAIDSVFGYIANINYSAIGSGIIGFFEGTANTLIWIKDKLTGAVKFIANLPSLIMDNQGWILAGGGIAGFAAIVWKAYEVFRDFSKAGGFVTKLLGNSAETVKQLGELFESAGGSLKAFTLGIHVKSLMTIALAVGVLAVSFKLLADLDGNQIANGLYMIVGSLAALVGALTIMSKFDVTGSFGATLAIVGMSLAIGALAVAVKYLSDMNYAEMTQGIIGLVAILGTLTGAIVLMSKFGSSFAVGALQFIAIASAIHILISAMDKIGGLDPDSLTRSLVVLGTILTQLAIFIKLASSRSATFTASAVGILATAGAVLIIVKAMEQLAGFNSKELAKGLISVGLILGAIAAFSVIVSKSNMAVTGAGILLLAVALNALVLPIAALGNMKIETLAKGIGALALVLLSLAATTKLMTSAIPGAIAVTILAVALNLLIVPIAALGAMAWGTILTGIGALTLALVAFGGVAALLGVATLPLLGFGVAIAAIGAGFMMFGKGLLIITTTSVASVTIVLTAFASLVTGLVTLLPAITDLMMKIANAVVEVMVKMAPKVADAIGRLLMVIMEKVQEYLPQVVDMVLETLEILLTSLGEYLLSYLDIVADVLIQILETIATFVDDALRVVLDLLLTLINTIGEYVPRFIQAGTDLIIGFLDGLTENIPLIIESVAEFMVTMLTTMADTIDENGPLLVDSFMRIMGEIAETIVIAGASMVDAMFGWIPGVSEATERIGKTAGKYIEDNFRAKDIGTNKGKEFSTSLSGANGLAKSAGESIARAGTDGASSINLTATGQNAGIGFANGLSSSGVLSSVISSAKSLASSAYDTIVNMLDIHSPSRVTTELGEHTGQGFANGVANKNKSVVESLFGWLPGMKETSTKAATQASTSGEKVGTSAVSGVSKGLKKSAPKATKAAKKTAKKTAKDVAKEAMDAFKKKMDDLEYKFEMGEIDNDKLLKGVQKLKKEYAKYPEVVKEASRKIKKIEDDMAKDVIDRENKIHNKRKALIDERKYYNELSLKQELEAWERMQAREAEGTEKRKEADREVYRLKKEMHGQIVSLNEEYFSKVQEINQKLIDDELALNDKYKEALDSRTADLRSSLGGIFEEFATKSDVSGKKLMDNLRTQVNGFMSWSHNIRSLATKGIDEGLLEELREMGPKAASEIAALNGLTHLELQEYSGLWKIANELARTEAMGELQGMKEDTAKQIEELRKDARDQLELYKDEWLTKLKEIRTGVPDQFGGLDASMEDIGKNAMKGFQQGLSKMKGPLLTEAKNLAKSVDNEIRKTLKIKSPSRVLMGDGQYAGEGLALGIRNSISTVVSSAKSMATQARDAIKNFTDGIELPETDNEIRIKAIVEYDGDAPPDMFKMGTNTVVPDLSNTQALSSSIKSVAQVRQESSQPVVVNAGVKEELGGLVSSINSLLDKPQPIQLFVDGTLMTEVVSRNQYSNRTLGAMTKGV